MRFFELYLLRNLLSYFLIGIFTFSTIYNVNVLYSYLDWTLNTSLNLSLLMLFYSLPEIIVLSFPIIYMFAVFLFSEKLYKDKEYLVKFNILLVNILFYSLVISYLSFFINENLVPYSKIQLYNIARDMMNNQNIKEKVFINKTFVKKENEKYLYTEKEIKAHLYAEKVNKESSILENIFIFDKSNYRYPKLIIAKKAIKSDTKLILKDVVLRSYHENGFINSESKLDKFEMKLKYFDFSLPRHLTVEELGEKIDDEKAKKKDTTELEKHYYLRYSKPLSTFFIALIAIPIGLKSAKMGTDFIFSLSVALVFTWYLIYTNLIHLVVMEFLPVFWSTWFENIILGSIGITMLFFVNKK